MQMLPKLRPGDSSIYPLSPYQHEFISIKASFLNQVFFSFLFHLYLIPDKHKQQS